MAERLGRSSQAGLGRESVLPLMRLLFQGQKIVRVLNGRLSVWQVT